ncbi:hypothetical protein T01_11407 [Trichinella spiralis]|uniref:Uncharacterized protein n=1 Tax=Trichinella spiralis TaxID=6334 RepID=A0A0V1ANX3_TRISP|nr:hypothetical protein T01_11407 [Trichinella spiralis]
MMWKKGVFALVLFAALCELVAFVYMLYKAVKLKKEKRKKKIKQTKQNVNKFLDLLPPPGQTAPLNTLLYTFLPGNQQFLWLRLKNENPVVETARNGKKLLHSLIIFLLSRNRNAFVRPHNLFAFQLTYTKIMSAQRKNGSLWFRIADK